MKSQIGLKNFKLGDFLSQFEEKSFFFKWYDAQPTSAKIGFFAAAAIAMITHLVAYSTLLLEEHVPGFSFGWRTDQRWFHNWINSLNFYYLNWVSGLMQVFFLSMIVFIVIKAFGINNKLHALLIAGLMVTFPTIANTNIFTQDVAPYFFAAFLSIWAFYLTKIHKAGWILGSVLIMLGLAIYQAKISVAMVASLICLILYVLEKNPKFMDFVMYSSRYFLLILGGLVYYGASFVLFDFTLDAHRGINRVISFDTLRNLPETLPRVYLEVYYYFFSTIHDAPRIFRIPSRWLVLSYGFVFIMGIITMVHAIKSKCKSPLNVVIICVLILLLPIAANFSRLFDAMPDMLVIMMTSYAFVFFLILPLIFWDNIKINTFGLKKVAYVAFVFIIGYYISFSNFIYLRAEVMTTRHLHFTNRVAARIEPLLPHSTNNQVFLLGNIAYNPIYPHMADFTLYTPRTTVTRMWGVYDVGYWPSDFIGNVMGYRIGLNVAPVPCYDKKMYLADRAITYGMPVWPQEGSVAFVDGVIVGMFNFFGRVDVENTGPGSFVATANHTGKASDLMFSYDWYLYRDWQRLRHVYSDVFGSGELRFEIDTVGFYRFRVLVRLMDGTEIIDNFSAFFEVE